jgi:glycine cleavage system aminomethyltransferase T
LGHVNKLLVPVKFPASGTVPAGTELRVGEKLVGRVTSASWSPRHRAILALAYVRREHAKAGSRVDSPAGEGEIVPFFV